MPIFSQTGGSFRNVRNLWINVGGAWRVIDRGWINVSGAWRRFYQRLIEMTIGSPNTNLIASGTSISLRQLFLNQFPGDAAFSVNVNFTLRGNIGSTSTAVPSLDTGVWPAGSVIKLIIPPTSGGTGSSPANGIIAGKGGGANCSGCCYQASFQGQFAEKGGIAINMQYPLTIENSGVIGSGGQGGSAQTHNRQNPTIYPAGGGAGINPGRLGGDGVQCPGQRRYRGSATDGSYLYAGSGGAVNGADLGKLNRVTGGVARPAIQTNNHVLSLFGPGRVEGPIT